MQFTDYSIEIDGKNVTSTVVPLLISLTVNLKPGGASDKADLLLDDKGGRLILPREGATFSARIRRKEVFRGKVTEAKSKGGRGSGRTLSISADGVNTKGKAKEPQERNFDNKTIEEILKEAGADADITTIKVDKEIGSIKIDYEAMDGESFMSLGQRLAEAYGGTFSISDGRAALVKRSGGTSASGKPLKKIIAAWGKNLKDWDIAPYSGRARYKRTRQRYYDQKEAKWKEVVTEVEDKDASATHTHRHPASDESAAKKRTQSDKTTAEREKGGGTIDIDGDEHAMPEAPVELIGARPGVDGEYKAAGVTHSISRSGFDTALEVNHPSGSAGVDKRAKK